MFITSIRKLSKVFWWSNTKVSNFLNLLEKDNMIKHKKDTKKTIITIVNYSKYQNINFYKNDTNQTPNNHKNISTQTNKHTNNNNIIINNNVNNYLTKIWNELTKRNDILNHKIKLQLNNISWTLSKDEFIIRIKKFIDVKNIIIDNRLDKFLFQKIHNYDLYKFIEHINLFDDSIENIINKISHHDYSNQILKKIKQDNQKLNKINTKRIDHKDKILIKKKFNDLKNGINTKFTQ